jgi:hypothetical protein
MSKKRGAPWRSEYERRIGGNSFANHVDYSSNQLAGWATFTNEIATSKYIQRMLHLL